MKMINCSMHEERSKSKGSHFENKLASWNDGYFEVYQMITFGTCMDAAHILMYQVTCF